MSYETLTEIDKNLVKVDCCPFCNTPAKRLNITAFNCASFRVGCTLCEALGPRRNTALEAVFAWNMAKESTISWNKRAKEKK